MCSLANHDTLWHAPTTIVLGAFCLTAVILVVATVVHDFFWRRNERKRRTMEEGAPSRGSSWRPALDVRLRVGGRDGRTRGEGVVSGARGVGVGVDRDRVG